MTWNPQSAFLCCVVFITGIYAVEPANVNGHYEEMPAAHKYLLDGLNPGLTWEEARLFCIEWGGDLANITSTAEEIFIKDVIIAKYSRDDEYHFWVGTIGLEDRAMPMTTLTTEKCYYYLYNAYDPQPPPPIRQYSQSTQRDMRNDIYPSSVDCTLRKGYICEKFQEIRCILFFGWTLRRWQ